MDSFKDYKIADLSSQLCKDISKFEYQLKQEVGENIILIAYKKDVKNK